MKRRSIVGQAVRSGLKRRHIGWDVATLAELPPSDVFAPATPKQQRVPRSLTRDEAPRFVAATEGRQNVAALVVALTVPLRPASFWRCAWTMSTSTPARSTCAGRGKGRGGHRHLGAPKTRGSVRTVSLPSAVVERLKFHRCEFLERRLMAPLGLTVGQTLSFHRKLASCSSCEPASSCERRGQPGGRGPEAQPVRPAPLGHLATSGGRGAQ